MSMTADKIVTEALGLSPQARAFVAERLIESLDAAPGTEVSAAWREEIRRRCREVDEGHVELSAAADVFANAYASLE
jgi:putative addiction module component (TIGR02574 family)